MFVTFEGIEGCGKTTQLGLLAERLEAAGRRVVRTREPGGTPLADEIRALFLRPREAPVAGETELFLVLASRASHVRELVRPALAAGAVVLCDRYADSSLAYQGFARGLDLDAVRRANALATGGLLPDWTVVFDLPAAVGLARARSRNATGSGAEARLDEERSEFHERVRAGFLALAREAPERFTVVDAARSVEAIAADVAAEAHRRGLLPEAR